MAKYNYNAELAAKMTAAADDAALATAVDEVIKDLATQGAFGRGGAGGSRLKKESFKIDHAKIKANGYKLEIDDYRGNNFFRVPIIYTDGDIQSTTTLTTFNGADGNEKCDGGQYKDERLNENAQQLITADTFNMPKANRWNPEMSRDEMYKNIVLGKWNKYTFTFVGNGVRVRKCSRKDSTEYEFEKQMAMRVRVLTFSEN